MSKILWLTKMAPADIDSAGLIYQYRMIEVLSKYHQISVVFMKADYGVNPLIKLGVQAHPFKGNEWLAKFAQEYDIAIINFWEIGHQLMHVVRNIVKKVIVNTIDVEYLRRERQQEFENTQNHKQLELEVYKKADELWFVTNNDRDVVLKEIQKQNHVFPIMQKSHHFNYTRWQNKNKLYFLGNYLHEPNVDAVRYLLKEIIPGMSSIEYELFIIGKWPPADFETKNPKIKITGIVYTLDDLLNQLGILICPLRYGAGLKGKVCEAMAMGIPVIGTEIAFEGLDVIYEGDKKEAFLCSQPNDFIDSFLALQNSEELFYRVGKNSHEKMMEYSYEKVGDRLLKSIGNIPLSYPNNCA